MEDPNLQMRQTGLDFNYLKSVPGLLKILEIVRDGNIFLTQQVKWSVLIL